MKAYFRTGIVWLLSVLLLWANGAFAAGAQASKVIVEDAFGAPGEETELSVRCEAFDAVGALDLEIFYPTEALTLLSVKPAELLKTGVCSINRATAGRVSLSAGWADGVSGAGKLLDIRFRVKDSAAPGGYTVSAGVGDTYTVSRVPTAVSCSSGCVTVTDQPSAGQIELNFELPGPSYALSDVSDGEYVCAAVLSAYNSGVTHGGSITVRCGGSAVRCKASALLNGMTVERGATENEICLVFPDNEAIAPGPLAVLNVTAGEPYGHVTLDAVSDSNRLSVNGRTEICVFKTSFVQAPTCVKQGKSVLICADCGNRLQVPLTVLPHVLGSGEKGNDGLWRRSCESCGQTFAPYAPGDVDADGKVTSADARLALRASVKLERYDPLTAACFAADADGDGSLSSADARIILRASVGLEKLE